MGLMLFPIQSMLTDLLMLMSSTSCIYSPKPAQWVAYYMIFVFSHREKRKLCMSIQLLLTLS